MKLRASKRFDGLYEVKLLAFYEKGILVGFDDYHTPGMVLSLCRDFHFLPICKVIGVREVMGK